MRRTWVLATVGMTLAPTFAYAQERQDQGAISAAKEDAAFDEVLNKPKPGGYTAVAVGRRAAETSYDAKASEEALRGAAARVDAAWIAFLPRLSGVASYTRLSEFTPPSLLAGSPVSLVGTPTTGSSSVDPNSLVQIPASLFTFPLVFNNWNLQATLTVPISDYFLRINQNYTAATHAQTAAKYDVAAARAKAASDGEVAFYNWIRAKGSVVVAELALQDQKTHLNDTKNLFTVGNATQVDVLRGETAVSAAELTLVQSKNLADLAEKQVRTAMHIDDAAALESGEAIDATTPPPVSGDLRALIAEAKASRFEVKSIEANVESAKKSAEVAKASAYPVLSAFGDVIYANPNPRVFPASDMWFPTWDVGARLTWSPNDVPTALANANDARSRAAQLDAQKQSLIDGIGIEVTQQLHAVQEADFSLQSSAAQLKSAREAVRVARELFNAGRVNSTTLTDAETDLTRARLTMLNARIDARTARVRLDHALGRDTRMVQISP